MLDGAELPGTYQVISISVIRELNRIPSAIIHLQDGEASSGTFEASNSAFFVPGKKVDIQLGYGSRNDHVFKGI